MHRTIEVQCFPGVSIFSPQFDFIMAGSYGGGGQPRSCRRFAEAANGVFDIEGAGRFFQLTRGAVTDNISIYGRKTDEIKPTITGDCFGCSY